jgi:alkylation response protein AidB-like acyl-CoA dehydrogenase
MATQTRTRPAARANTDVVAIARQLADEFRPRATDYDRTGAFPTENYDRMREAGYLRALVPAELGGLGAGYLEMARAQQALARGCASTALAVNMHQFQIGFMGDSWRKTGAAPAEKALRRVAEEGIILGSTGAERLSPLDHADGRPARGRRLPHHRAQVLLLPGAGDERGARPGAGRRDRRHPDLRCAYEP